MTTTITKNLRVTNAKDFLENFSGGHSVARNFYMFLARSLNWNDETQPPAPTTAVVDDADVRQNLLGLKKINENDLRLGVRKYVWDSSGNTVYFPYDDRDGELLNHPTQSDIDAQAGYVAGSHYMVVEPELHVFKCLYRPSDTTKSTQKPSKPLSAPWITEESDGYIWKYLFTLSGEDATRFTNASYFPVTTLTSDDGNTQWDVQTDAVAGKVENVIIDNGGTGYTQVTAGDPNGFASAGESGDTVFPLNLNDAQIAGAYVGATIWFTSGVADGAYRVITAYDDVANKVTVGTAVTGVVANDTYEIYPTAIIEGDGTGLVLKPTTTLGIIDNVDIIQGGSDYRITRVTIQGGGGTGASIHAPVPIRTGHGSDAERELGASTVIVEVQVPHETGLNNDGTHDFPNENDYRQIGIIRDVVDADGVTLSTDGTLHGQTRLTLSNVVGTPAIDQEINGADGSDTASGRIIEITDIGSGNFIVSVTQNIDTGFDSFTSDMSVTTASASADIDTVTAPELSRHLGDLLLLNNIQKVTRQAGQTGKFIFLLRF